MLNSTGINNALFSKHDWFSFERHQTDQLLLEIDRIDGNRLLNSSVEDLCNYFDEKYRIIIPNLKVDDITSDQFETNIDVTHNPRYSFHYDGAVVIKGTAIEINIPFDGDEYIFHIRPTTYTMSPPRAEIRNQSLILMFKGANLSSENVRRDIEATIQDIQNHLSTLSTNAQGFNNKIKSVAMTTIEKRREKLLSDQELISSLGYKIKVRDNSPQTYTTQAVRRRIAPQLPPASTAKYNPEPVLSDKDYEDILTYIQNMALVMERSPSAFKLMDEEMLRTHFLVPLNGRYEGKATAETFNYEGKTDILIRDGGKNIFIAECKFWSGPSMLIDTIDQILSYSSWRDTKIAIIIFNRNKDFSNVLTSIQKTAVTHQNYKRNLKQRNETSFSYIFSNRDDVNREMVITILAFNIPT